MMLKRIHLEILNALDIHGSLTKAAETLCLTQPALTHSIKKMEQIFGIKTWYKEGRELRLTQSGQFILKEARHILPQFSRMEQTLKMMSLGKKGLFRIGVECHPCYEWLIRVTGVFLKEWKDVDIDVTRRFQFDGKEALLTHQVDLIISPDKFNHKDLICEPVMEFELLLITHPNHPFAGKKYIEPKDLVDQTLLTYPVPNERLDIFVNFLIPGCTRPEKHITIEATEIIIQLVASGRGVSTFPHWLIKKYLPIYNINGVSLGRGGIQKKLFLIIRKEDSSIEYVKDFISRCQCNLSFNS